MKLTRAAIIAMLGLMNAAATAATSFSTFAAADAFGRQQAPTSNYGASGALSVAGAASVNGGGQSRGRADTLLKFDAAGAVAAFDAAYGAGNWQLSGARLRLTEVGAPNNGLFARGAGPVALNWISGDNWSEGSGIPNAPTVGTGDQLTWDYLQALLGSASSESLGGFTRLGSDNTRWFTLALTSGFAADLVGGGAVTLHALPAADALGFTFNGRSMSSDVAPVLELSAIPEPSAGLMMMMLWAWRHRARA